VALEVAYILESSHVEHIDCSIIRASDYLALGQLQSYIHSACVILTRSYFTDEKEADLAIFFTPVMGMLAKLSIIALVLDSLMLVIELLPLCNVINNGPAWDSLF
jgi:hypothetical protein